MSNAHFAMMRHYNKSIELIQCEQLSVEIHTNTKHRKAAQYLGESKIYLVIEP